jgi:arylsulfatase A-like enzyme
MKSTQPNVIIVMTDDQGYADLGCTGNPWIQTPNIDRFFEESVRMTDFHVQPLCTPTRGALMSGHRPIRNGAWATNWGRSILRESETTMADVFKSGGYRTGMFGKWHLGDCHPYRPFERGFDHTVAHKGGGVGQTSDFWGNNYFDDTYFANGQARGYEGYCTDVWFEQAKDWIESEDERPFFAYIATNAPHCPYLVDDRYAEQYRANPKIAEPEFYGMITNIDENFGDLMSFLEKKGMAENTILVFMTDNGSSGGAKVDDEGYLEKGYNAGMRGLKGSYYDGGHRVPFMIRWPKGRLGGGRDVGDMALDVDVLPTMIDLCGLPDPKIDFDGVSFVPTFGGEKLPERTHFIQIKQRTEAPDQWRCCVMTSRWRLIGYDELYDIKSDPEQRENVIEDYPDVANQLRQQNEDWWVEARNYFEDLCPIYLGAKEENPVTMSSMDLNGDNIPIVWTQTMVVFGREAPGTWHVKVTRAGRYRIDLRRWPSELPIPIEGTVSRECSDGLIYARKDNKDHVIVEPDKAKVKIFDQTYSTDVLPGHEAAHFEVEIDEGLTELEASFWKDDARLAHVYFVDVEFLGSATPA